MSDLPEPKDGVTDPVCGRPVDPLRARAVGIFNGVTHYFCSQECKTQFGDPRMGPTVPNRGPNGTERRFTDPAPFGDASGQWFTGGDKSDKREPTDRFDDLKATSVGGKESVSPSVLIDVRATKPKTTRLYVLAAVIFVAVVGAVLALHH